MECKKVLQVTKEEFFNQVQHSVLEDIKAATGKKPNVVALQNEFTYKKQIPTKLGRKDNVKIVIEQFHYPTDYCASFHGAQGVNKISYHVESIGDNEIEVSYKEDFSGKGKLKTYNFKIMQKLYSKSSQKRVNRLLSSMEQYIVTNRDSKE